MLKRCLLFSFFCCFVFLVLAIPPLSAQEEGDEDEQEGGGSEIPIESDWSFLDRTLYARGDQTFIISLGVTFPALFMGDSINTSWFFENNINLGGTGSLSYNYFFGPHFYIGGELGGMFSSTLGQNMYYVVPMGFRMGYQITLNRFEIPINVMIGMAPQIHRDKNYLGLIVKPGASLFWRLNMDWSFGLNTFLWWLPQWTSESSKNINGSFLELTLSARYHF